jgi:hypothetical protein
MYIMIRYERMDLQIVLQHFIAGHKSSCTENHLKDGMCRPSSLAEYRMSL